MHGFSTFHVSSLLVALIISLNKFQSIHFLSQHQIFLRVIIALMTLTQIFYLIGIILYELCTRPLFHCGQRYSMETLLSVAIVMHAPSFPLWTVIFHGAALPHVHYYACETVFSIVFVVRITRGKS